MKQIRLFLIGFGVVGQGLAELVGTKKAWLRDQHHVDITLAGVANSRHGFIYHEAGLDSAILLSLANERRALTNYPGSQHRVNIQDGLQAFARRGDILVEVTGTNLRDGEPGLGHIRSALQQGLHVVTANKGPGALAAQELFALAQQQGCQLRMEATVMAGTPVISTATEGLAGAQVQAIRGLLNGTTNYILTAMAQGRDYAEVLAEAQTQGYAEADPTADVEGYDVVAKMLILSSLVFGHTLTPEQVARKGITTVTPAQIEQARQAEKRIKFVASLYREGDSVKASVEPVALPLQDPLARVDGVVNAVTFQTDTLAEVTVIGPGAGRLQTGQGLLADVLAVARALR